MVYKLKMKPDVIKQAQREGIQPQEFDVIVDELLRISQLQNPRSDWCVGGIRCTDNEWSRVRHDPHTWRAIIEIDDGKRTIELLMILRRCNTTYRIVEARWLEQGAA